LTNLEYLDLSFTRVSDRGLEDLDSLKKLTEIYLAGTDVTDSGSEHLQRSHPGIKVHRTTPTR
jgi:hypothetical protein